MMEQFLFGWFIVTGGAILGGYLPMMVVAVALRIYKALVPAEEV